MAVAEITRMDEFLAREYLSSLRQFPDRETQQWLLRESSKTLVRTKDPFKGPPSATVSNNLPKELAFLGGHLCNLGFDKSTVAQGRNVSKKKEGAAIAAPPLYCERPRERPA